jgi:hypothetical protein
MRWLAGHADRHTVPRAPVALPPAPQHTSPLGQLADVMQVTMFAVAHTPVGSQTLVLAVPASVRVEQQSLPVPQFGQVPTPPSPVGDPLLLELLVPLLEPLLELLLPPLELLLELLLPPLELPLLLLELDDASGVLFELSSLLQATTVLPTPSATTKSPRMSFMAGTVATLTTFAASLSRREWPYRLAIGPLRRGWTSGSTTRQ